MQRVFSEPERAQCGLNKSTATSLRHLSPKASRIGVPPMEKVRYDTRVKGELKSFPFRVRRSGYTVEKAKKKRDFCASYRAVSIRPIRRLPSRIALAIRLFLV